VPFGNSLILKNFNDSLKEVLRIFLRKFFKEAMEKYLADIEEKENTLIELEKSIMAHEKSIIEFEKRFQELQEILNIYLEKQNKLKLLGDNIRLK
jgi:hypothetical protein